MSKSKKNRIGDEAVAKATGKRWAEWFRLLDEAGSASKTHREIAAWIDAQFDCSGWWCQMITVQYERKRGLREMHEKPDGFEAGKSKTLSRPAGTLYRAWAEEEQRQAWLQEPGPGLEIRTARPDRSLRIDWPGGSRVAVDFNARGKEKCQVVIQHSRLPDQQAVQQWKAFWAAQLERLDAWLDSA